MKKNISIVLKKCLLISISIIPISAITFISISCLSNQVSNIPPSPAPNPPVVPDPIPPNPSSNPPVTLDTITKNDLYSIKRAKTTNGQYIGVRGMQGCQLSIQLKMMYM